MSIGTSAEIVTAAACASAEPRARRLRVVFCTRGGLFGALVLAQLAACRAIELCGIVRSSRTYHPDFGFLRGSLGYLRRCGLTYSWYLFCATTLAEALCALARLRRASARAHDATAPHGVPVLTTRDVNDTAGLEFLRASAPDLLVSAFFDQRLHAAALAIPARAVNIHPSLLPAFRGVDPVLQARLQRAGRLGVTVHYMVPALDAGNLLAQRALEFHEKNSIFAMTALLFQEGARLLVGRLEQIERGDPGTPQPGGGSYQSWPTRAEVRALRAAGCTLFRFSDVRRVLTPPHRGPRAAAQPRSGNSVAPRW